MPQSGPRILFWRAGVVAEDSPAPTLAERIDAIGQALARYRRIVRTSEAVIAGGDLSAEAMRAEHDALSALLARVSVQETQIKTLCETLHNQRGRFLSSWRVTEREILTTNCGQLLRDMQAVLQRIKRVQVDISGRLLEQE